MCIFIGFSMTQQSFISKIQTNEHLLKQQAHTIAPDAYEKLVVEHLHLIASLKTVRQKEKQEYEVIR